MSLTTKIKQELKAKAHALKPVVLLGNHGLTEAVKKEIDHALAHHELIKVRIQNPDRDERRALFLDMCNSIKAELIQVIGNIGVIYRQNEKELPAKLAPKKPLKKARKSAK